MISAYRNQEMVPSGVFPLEVDPDCKIRHQDVLTNTTPCTMEAGNSWSW